MNNTQLQETADRVLATGRTMEVTMIQAAMWAAGAETEMGLSREQITKLALAVWRIANRHEEEGDARQ